VSTGESPNRQLLEAVARQIRPLLDRVVFVGGQVGEVYITDPAAVRVRPTTDVDVVVSVATRAAYHRIEEEVRELGFRNDQSEEALICRWISPTGHQLDLMPVDASILGFTNRWYPMVVEEPVRHSLTDDLSIQVPTAPVFLATKLEAFASRGASDLLGSWDLEDVILLVAGRPELFEEIQQESPELRRWVAEEVGKLLEEAEFSYAIQGALPEAGELPGYLEVVMDRFEALTRPG
jgi:predicted nucleotidyltransferase